MTATTTPAAKASELRFVNPTAKDMVVGLVSGHTLHIPPRDDAPNGVICPRRFQKAALAMGALPEGVEEDPGEDEANLTETREQIIERALLAMVKGNETTDFKKDGTPNLNAVQHRVGFGLSREDVMPIWQKVSNDLDAAERAEQKAAK